ncbi:hypothetical protein EXS57_03015 [Candidatus Kaiserbacteria bacterium]|nr:hypothetical protein [Candidatus Kaiserbacteria bacterium]
MTERKPKTEGVVDFVERQRQKSNSGKREELDETPDGYAFLYPEEKIQITASRARISRKYCSALNRNFSAPLRL